MSIDVTRRLWSWDGWPPHSVSNRLFVRRKYILIPFEGPKQGQKRLGFLRTSLVPASGDCSAIYCDFRHFSTGLRDAIMAPCRRPFGSKE
jgi:hypothetical protein